MSEQEKASRRKRLQTFIGRLATSRVGSFSIIGIALTIFGQVFIQLAKRWGMSPQQANLAQAGISVLLNFLLNYYFTWSDSKVMGFRKHALRFALAKAGTLSVNYVLFNVSLALFRAAIGPSFWIISDDTFAYIFSTAVITVANYPIMDDFVFGRGTWKEDGKLMFVDMFRLFTLRPMKKKVVKGEESDTR